MKVLETKRLVLRPWRETDSHDLYEYAKSELVGPNAGWKPHKDIEESKRILKMFIEQDDVYAIVLKAEDKVIGSIGIHSRTPDEALAHLRQKEIGYVLNPRYWGNRYMLEAIKCVMKYSFNELQLDVIWCAHYDFNERSKKIITKSGFKYKFTKKQTLQLLNDQEVMTLYYSIFRKEYTKNIVDIKEVIAEGVNKEVLKYLDEGGKVRVWPAKQSKKLIVLEYIASKIESEKVYTEKEITMLVDGWSVEVDGAFLRRELFEKDFIERTNDGSKYWKA